MCEAVKYVLQSSLRADVSSKMRIVVRLSSDGTLLLASSSAGVTRIPKSSVFHGAAGWHAEFQLSCNILRLPRFHIYFLWSFSWRVTHHMT